MSEEDEPRVLTASIADFRYFAALLKGINFTNRACVSITADGFTVAVEEARVLVATAYVFKHVFDEFVYDEELARLSQAQDDEEDDDDEDEDAVVTTAFEIPLNTLMECLNIFGTAGQAVGSATKKKKEGDGDDSEADGGGRRDKGKGRADADNTRIDQWFTPGKGTGVRLTYTGPGHPLNLFVAEETGGPTASCEVTTWDPEPRMVLGFDADRAVLKIILKSSWLRDALSELDSHTEKLTIIGNPPTPGNRVVRNAPPRLRLRAVGQFGTTEMDYPNDREVLETCDCPHPVSFTYKFSHVSRAMRALQLSTKTSMRIDDEGMISMQFMMPTRKRPGVYTQSFIELCCLPLED